MADHKGQTSLRPVLVSAEPQLFVTDIKASCDFFTQRLGFKVAFVYGEPPFYGQVIRDGAELNLRCVEKPVIDSKLRQSETLLSASMTVTSAEEIRQLFEEFQSRGVTFHQTLRIEQWGSLTFIVRDPDGNLLLFGAPSNS